VFIGGLCNNVKFFDCPVVNQSYMHYSVKYICYPWLLLLESDFAMVINFQMLTCSLSRGHPVVFEYNIKMK